MVGLAKMRLIAPVASGVGVVALVLVGLNAYLYFSNRALQSDVNERQRTINDSLRLSQLNNQLIQSLVSLAASGGDEQIRDLLSKSGVTFTVKPAPNDASPPAAGEQPEPGSQ